MSNLIESFPTWYDPTTGTGGIFKTLYDNTTIRTKFTWLSNYEQLDMEYFGNHSGEKHASPLIEKFIAQNVASSSTTPYVLTTAQRNALANIIAMKYDVKWKKLNALTTTSYNPLENYSMTETETDTTKVYTDMTNTQTNNLTDTTKTATDLTHTTTNNLTDTTKTATDITHTTTNNTQDITKTATDITHTETFTNVKDETKTATDVTHTETYNNLTDTTKSKSDFTTTGNVYGFNSVSAQPTTSSVTQGDADDNVVTAVKSGSVTKTDEGNATDNVVTATKTGTITTTDEGLDTANKSTLTKSGTVTTTDEGSANDNVVTETKGGTVTVRDSGTDTNNKVTETNSGTITTTNVGDGDDNKTVGNRSLTRSGNIGVTTSQQMAQSEIELWQWNFFNQVYADIDQILTLSIY